MPRFESHSLALRAQALTLLATKKYTREEVSKITRMPVRSLQYLNRKARERGFDPEVDPRIKMEYVEDGKRSGRPEISEAIQQAVIESVTKDGSGCEKSSRELAHEIGISRSSVQRILHGFTNATLKSKPGLSNPAKE